jgi:ribosomal protein S18 acetylase RimI-like enzyme
MIFRKATAEDIEALIQIRLAYLIEDYGEVTEDQIERLRLQLSCYYADHIGKDFIAYLALDKENIVSSVFLVIIEKPSNPSFISGKVGNILNVYTKPEYRCQGLAGRLLTQAIEEAKQLELSYLELKATKAGYSLYKKLGFLEAHSDYIAMRYPYSYMIHSPCLYSLGI